MFGKYPSLFLLSFTVPSIALASQFSISAWLFFVLATGAVVFAFVANRLTWRIAAAIAFGLAIGLLAGAHFSLRYITVGPSHVSRVVIVPERAHIFGKISDWPNIRVDQTELTIALDSLGAPDGYNRPVGGAILLKVTDTTTALQRGDRIEFIGRLYPTGRPDAWDRNDYRRRLSLRGISAIVYLPTLLDVRVDRRYPWGIFGLADRLHDVIVGAINADLPEDTRALAAGFLIGETRGIPVDVYQRFRDSGTLHVLAVSGGNVALVCLFTILLLRPLSAFGRARSIVLLMVVVMFALVCYAEPSVVRASVMAVLVIVARMLQRKIDLHNIIALTAVLVLLFDPAQLFDIGAQLSFACAWGLILLMPHVAARFESVQHRRWYRWLLFPALVSLVAQLCSTPLIAYYFGTVPMISVFANLVVVPMAAVATLGTLAMLTAHLLLPVAGAFLGSLVHPVLLLLRWFTDFFGSGHFPGLQLPIFGGQASAILNLVFIYGLIAVLGWSLSHKPARRLSLLLAAVYLNTMLLSLSLQTPSDNDRLLRINTVPGGIAVSVTSPDSSTAMVITGLLERPYDLDRRILRPIVETQHLSRPGRLFVLAGDYGAADDLLRFAVSAHIDTLYVDARLGGSVRETADRLGLEGQMAIREFGGEASGQTASVRADSRGVLIITDRHSVLITRSLPGAPEILEQPDIWICGRTWRPTPDDWLALQRSGVKRIICSRIEQALPEDEGARAADLALPEWISDLSRSTSVTISLPD